MYDDLIPRLRVFAAELRKEEDALLVRDAADAIEELSAFREHITDGRFYCMRDGVLYEANVEPPKGKVFQLPPIEFACDTCAHKGNVDFDYCHICNNEANMYKPQPPKEN